MIDNRVAVSWQEPGLYMPALSSLQSKSQICGRDLLTRAAAEKASVWWQSSGGGGGGGEVNTEHVTRWVLSAGLSVCSSQELSAILSGNPGQANLSEEIFLHSHKTHFSRISARKGWCWQ